MKIIGICAPLLAISLISACGGGDASESTGSADGQAAPCALLPKANIKAVFPHAKNINLQPKDSVYPMCTAKFSVNDDKYRVSLTLAFGAGSESNLKHSVSMFKSAKPEAVPNLGEGAFYVGSPLNQVSVWVGDDLFHLAMMQTMDLSGLSPQEMMKRARMGPQGDKAKDIALARKVVESLE